MTAVKFPNLRDVGVDRHTFHPVVRAQDYSALSSKGAIALAISCFGAFGLAASMVARRTREVCIRKVLGGSAARIAALLLRDFAVTVGIGALLAWPAARFAVGRWLQTFAYCIDLGPGVYLLGSLLTLAVVVATVASQCVRAAHANPVDALRSE